MIPTIVNVSGLDRISKWIYTQATVAIYGMAEPDREDCPLIAAIRTKLSPDIGRVEVDATINDSGFSEACARAQLKT